MEMGKWQYYRIKTKALIDNKSGKEVSVIDILSEELGCLDTDIEWIKGGR